MFDNTFSAGSLTRTDFCLISVPLGHCDEPEILPYENASACPIGSDSGHSTPCILRPRANGQRGIGGAFLRCRIRTAWTLLVEHYSAAVNKQDIT